jgi:hypothetical protein
MATVDSSDQREDLVEILVEYIGVIDNTLERLADEQAKGRKADRAAGAELIAAEQARTEERNDLEKAIQEAEGNIVYWKSACETAMKQVGELTQALINAGVRNQIELHEAAKASGN